MKGSVAFIRLPSAVCAAPRECFMIAALFQIKIKQVGGVEDGQ